MDYRVLRAERPGGGARPARRRGRGPRDQRPADARDDGDRVPDAVPGGLARGGPRPADRLHRRRRAHGVDQRGQYLPLHPQAVGPHRAASTPCAAAWSATGWPPSASSSCATWRRRTPTSRRRSPTSAATQDRVLREAAVRAQLQRYVSPRLADMALAQSRASSTGPATGARPPCSSPTSAGYTRLIETTPGARGHPPARRLPQRDDRGDLPPPGHRRAAHRRRDRGALRRHRGRGGRAGAGRARGPRHGGGGAGALGAVGRRGAARDSTSAWGSPRGR